MWRTKSRLPSLYNPATQSSEEIVSNFVIRLGQFNELTSAIKSDLMEKPPQHYMIQGQRGYGKSTLLLRLKIEIENDAGLQDWLMPVMFDEEQYGIRNLAGLWVGVVEILVDKDQSFSSLSEKVDALHNAGSTEEEIYDLIMEELRRRKKKVVLLFDNFGDMIRKFSRKENQRLREILITSNQIRLVGASSAILEFYYNYKEPFFDFFKVITLEELDRDETIMLLRKLGETYKAEEINRIVDEQPERIDALRRLAGGVPRTMVLLFEIFVDDMDGNSFKDLEMTLDRVTPLYKHRLDSLSTQQQAIIDAIAQAWDAVSTKEIAAKVRMPSKSVSSQLNQLQKNQIIRKIPTSTKNHLYQINERFFNIYYLMRLGKRRNRNRVLWLVKFFEICCGETELVERTRKHIRAMQEGQLYDKHAFYISQALSKTHISYDLQHELLDETKKYLTVKQSKLAGELEPSHLEILREVAEDVKRKDLSGAQKRLEHDSFPAQKVAAILADLLQKEGNFQDAIKYYQMAIEKGNTKAMHNLALLYETEFKDFEKAEQYYKMAIEKGDASAIFNLANLYRAEFKDFEKAEQYYKMAIEKGDASAMNNLALLYKTEFKDFEKAEQYYKMAIEKGHTKAMYNLALLYKTEFKDFEKAEQYYQMAVEKGDASAMNNLALLYFERKKNKQEALQLQGRAYEISQDVNYAYGYITVLLWNDEVQGAIKVYESAFGSEEKQKEVDLRVNRSLLMLMAKKQYSFLYKLFQENKYDVKDKYKPVYYALLSLMGEKYSDELKKMGGELKESVQDVLKEVDNLAKAFMRDIKDDRKQVNKSEGG
jgi:TPR repeat protein